MRMHCWQPRAIGTKAADSAACVHSSMRTVLKRTLSNVEPDAPMHVAQTTSAFFSSFHRPSRAYCFTSSRMLSGRPTRTTLRPDLPMPLTKLSTAVLLSAVTSIGRSTSSYFTRADTICTAVVVLPVPGGPCTNVMPDTFLQSLIAFRWGSLYICTSHSSNLWGMCSSAGPAPSSTVPPADACKSGAACISVPVSRRNPLSSWLMMVSFKLIRGNAFSASNSRISVDRLVTLASCQLPDWEMTLAISMALCTPSSSFVLTESLTPALLSTMARKCTGSSFRGSSPCVKITRSKWWYWVCPASSLSRCRSKRSHSPSALKATCRAVSATWLISKALERWSCDFASCQKSGVKVSM
mmetsp:Transcript_19818/g.53902  ORF Transcript_19818/g.53902 Transcript_19818/m.53902 type:complete len:354 (-) Transcript_19818:234-1295(-)